MIAQIDGNMLKNMIISGANNIANHKKEINDLNVFPVPDGDTGTNMSLTMSAAIKELNNVTSNSAQEVSQKIANALLRGARGNSGVILSLIFRGFAKAMVGVEQASPSDFAKGLRLGVEMAYKAVMKPTEGTILTVARLSSDHAIEVAAGSADVIEVLKETIARGQVALDDTPNLLPVLKAANVVDAGGKGLLTIYEGALSYLMTGEMIENLGAQNEEADAPKSADFAALNTEDIRFQYCTEFIVMREGAKDAQKLRNFLEKLGDSVVLVDDEEIIKVHVHTNNPGKALEEALTFGSLTSMKIENMKEQHSELVVMTAQQEAPPAAPTIVPAHKDYGFVVVCAGEGIANVFYDLGADQIVQGGQTMNPSTDDILQAVYKTPASTVFVFPNNKNIIMAAEQAIPISKEKRVIVIPTKTIAQGVTAMLGFDDGMPVAENVENMTSAVALVKTGQITFAARDSQFDGHDIKEGQTLGMAEGKLQIIGDDLISTVIKLVAEMKSDENEILTLYYGSDVSDEQAQEIFALTQEEYGDQFEIVLINGGQPVYYFIVAIE